MRIIRIGLFLTAAWLLSGCEPSPKEAAEIFCRDLEAGNWEKCGQLMTPELREAFKKECRNWPVLCFAQAYYSDKFKCRFLKYETKLGQAHTLIGYSWTWNRAPVPGNVMLDLIWRPTNGCWRIEDIFASSHFDMLLPVKTNSPPELKEKALLTGCGLRYQKAYRENESWQDLGKALEDYLTTWYK